MKIKDRIEKLKTKMEDFYIKKMHCHIFGHLWINLCYSNPNTYTCFYCNKQKIDEEEKERNWKY